ncbi:MAG TPA: DUF3830 family protein [Opitutaceae bacterium]|nr:DUF3830 family protein [Opitutaceae bacterium]
MTILTTGGPAPHASVINPKRRQIRLTYPASGESVLAELLDDEAPGVCQLLWDMLPVETKAIHGMYSGAEVFAMVNQPKPAPAENMVQLPLPGEILYFYDPGTGGVGAKKPVGEIVVVYGRGVTLRAHEGVPTHCALCARIPGDWKYDWKNFAAECRKARWEGPQLLKIERA